MCAFVCELLRRQLGIFGRRRRRGAWENLGVHDRIDPSRPRAVPMVQELEKAADRAAGPVIEADPTGWADEEALVIPIGGVVQDALKEGLPPGFYRDAACCFRTMAIRTRHVAVEDCDRRHEGKGAKPSPGMGAKLKQ